MKLYVWQKSEEYESMLAFAIAENEEEAKKLIVQELGYPYKYPNIFLNWMNEHGSEYYLDKPVAYYMSHSG